jgi:fucose permease
MVIVIRALQAALLFFAFGAMVTAFVVGILVVSGTDSCTLVPEDNGSRSCAGHQAKATGAIGIGVAGVAGGLVAVALNGMARPKPQVQTMQPGQPRPTQQSTGPFPQPPPYGPPR